MTSPTVTAVSDVRYERTAHCLMEMMQAYERRVRSECKTPEDLAAEPWRCREFIAAEDALRKGWPAHNEALRARSALSWADSIIATRHGTDAEALKALRSALADVGECETCKGKRFTSFYPSCVTCEPCNGTGKQPRPAAEDEPRECGPCDGKVTAEQRAGWLTRWLARKIFARNTADANPRRSN